MTTIELLYFVGKVDEATMITKLHLLHEKSGVLMYSPLSLVLQFYFLLRIAVAQGLLLCIPLYSPIFYDQLISTPWTLLNLSLRVKRVVLKKHLFAVRAVAKCMLVRDLISRRISHPKSQV
jgi:hypothetical protein